MNKKTNIIFNIFLTTFLLFFSPFIVKAAGSASTGFSANNSVYVGNNIEVILYVSSVNGTNGGLAAFGGNISYSTDKLELVSSSSLAPFTVEINGSKLGGFGQNTIKGRSNIIKFVFKAKALGNATVSYSGSSQPDSTASPVSISGSSKTINIVNPPSSNNNLSSLSVNPGGISFNKNTTSYSVTVGSDVTSVNISASVEDGGASVSGTGNKLLNYGNNSFGITVTAPSGAKKTYTVNVTRKDDRSGNTNLSSLKVNGGDLKPGFSKSTTNYSLDVPFSIANLSVNATPEDLKAKVTVSGNNNLIAEETTTVTITVTAENGARKTYTINVKRGKDPNKVLSTNNYLSRLTVSQGILSPAFNREQENYIVYLPYEIDKISFDYGVEDTKYATVKADGPENLSIGDNNYKIIVTAEDNSTRTYSVIVLRGKSLTGESLSSNVYLKKIKIKDGSLKGKFDKKVHNYKYTGGEITAIPEDENSEVSIFKLDFGTVIMVKSPSGEIGIYMLVLSKSKILLWVALVLTIVAGVVGGYYFIKKKTPTDKKTKKKDNTKK